MAFENNLPVYTSLSAVQGTATGTAATLAAQTSASVTKGLAMYVQNTHASDTLYIGPSGVATGTGGAIPAGTGRFIPLPDLTAVYVVGNGVTYSVELYR